MENVKDHNKIGFWMSTNENVGKMNESTIFTKKDNMWSHEIDGKKLDSFTEAEAIHFAEAIIHHYTGDIAFIQHKLGKQV